MSWFEEALSRLCMHCIYFVNLLVLREKTTVTEDLKINLTK